MDVLHAIVKLGFFAATAVTVGAAVLVVTVRNIFHSALSLILALIGIAALYISLKAEFIAVIQILLYVGAIMTLVIFAIMLTSRIGDRAVPQTNKQSPWAFLVLIVFYGFFALNVMKTEWKVLPESLAAPIDAKLIGAVLMGEYVFPFEIASVVLLAALIGAIVLGRSDQ